MNRGFMKRLCALMLCVAITVGGVYVFPLVSRAEGGATVTQDGIYAKRGDKTDSGITLLYNRDFEDNKQIQNGLGLSSSAAINAMRKVTVGDNSYIRFTQQGAHDYFNIDVGSYAPASGSVVFQYDVMVEDNTKKISGAVQLNPKVRGSSSDVYTLISMPAPGGTTSLIPLNKSSSTRGYEMEAGVWYTVTIVWSYSSKDSVKVTLYNGAGATATYTDTANESTGCTDVRPGQVRMGINASATGSWCVDNIIIYSTGDTNPATAANHTVAAGKKGVMYQENGTEYVDPEAFVGNYYMKVGVTTALNTEDEKVALSEAPFEYGGAVYIPESSLGEMGIAAGSHISSVNGTRAVSIDDIQAATGLYSEYSSMGLIALKSKDTPIFTYDPTILLPIMKKFIFEGINSDLTNANAFELSDMLSLSHPYIFANQDKFDELHREYLNSTDPVLYSYIAACVKTAESNYKGYAKITDGAYDGMKNDYSKIPYISGYGYDVGGRQGDSAGHAERILNLAFGYQITRNEDYARLAYDYAAMLGQWEHWGPGHFLNCADASGPYATAYDWLYNIWVELGLDVTVIEEILFTHSILPSYYSIHDNGCPWYDPVVSSGWGFHKGSNNWNAVCSAGVTVAALSVVGLTDRDSAGALLDLDIDGVYTPTVDAYAGAAGTITRKDGKSFKTDGTGLDSYSDYAVYLVNQCLYYLPYYGMVQYAPDGSYIESNGYWSYGTNNFFEMTAALISATGGDYGLLDCWGIDRTAYYALNTQSSDYLGWNYHDSGSVGAQDTSWFQFLGNDIALGDKALAGIRKRILANAATVSPTRYDALYYMSDEDIGEFEMPEIQYYMEGIDGYVIRDSWDEGGIYAGILGNTNNLGHGQIDSGGFVYYNGSTRWICDIGTENYNCFGFWGAGSRYTYYKMNAEGNNTLLVTSRQDTIPYGQALSGFGYMTKTFDNAHGAYAVIDNKTAYGDLAEYAYRGMLFTNDRRTVVIQDEVKFYEEEDAVWTAHTEQEVAISVDGRVAYLFNGTEAIKLTIVDENGYGLRFEVTDAYDFLLDCTVGPTYSTDNGGVQEGDRSSYRRLIIRCDGVTELKLAVVIEEVALGATMNGDIGYEWSDMAEWLPTSDGRVASGVLGECDLDGVTLGNTYSLGGLTTDRTLVNGTGALLISPTASGYGEAGFTAKENKVKYGSLGAGKAVFEFELMGSEIPEGMRLGVSSNAGIFSSVELSDTVSIAKGEWVRITVILDTGRGIAYYYVDGVLVHKESYPHVSYENLSLSFSIDSSEGKSGAVTIDNLLIRYFTEDYTLLDGILESDISLWQDASVAGRKESGRSVVATVTLPYTADYPTDTPIVDVLGATVLNVSVDGVYSTVIELYDARDIQAALVEGATLTLLTDIHSTRLDINLPLTVVTNGFRYLATSESYIASVEDDTVTYKSGRVTVIWVIDGAEYHEIYTGSVTADYKGVLSEDIYEAENADGSYSYYTREGFSNVSGGAPLSDDEMIVTSQNRRFYLTGKRYEGAFVTVKNGVVTGYEDGASFYTSKVMAGSYDRISVTNDFSYVSTGINDSHSITGTLNLYLNGYTVYYDTKDSSDHMLTPNGSSAELNIYGPGEICSTTTTANIIYCSNGSVYAEGVTFTAPRSITDTRQGTSRYKDCTVNITQNSSAFVVNNRNNAVTNPLRYPTIFVDGCVITINGSTQNTSVCSITNNAVIEYTGGTVVNSSGRLFTVAANTTGTVSGFDYDNACNYAEARIGEVYYTCTAVCHSATNNTEGKVYDFSDKVYLAPGATLDEVTEATSIQAGYIAALTGIDGARYIIASADSCSLVTWRLGGSTVEEYWIEGATIAPVSEAVKALLDSSNAPDGMRYSFPAPAAVGGEEYELVATLVNDFTIKVNVSTHLGFNINVYVPTVIDGLTINGFTVAGAVAEYSAVSFDGVEYYRISSADLSPESSARAITFTILATDEDGRDTSISTDISIVAYARLVLEDEEQAKESKALIANILKYMDAAYVYSDNTKTQDYSKLKSLYSKYAHLATVSSVVREETNTSSIKDAVTSAYLQLEDIPYMVFKLNGEYTGRLVFEYEVMSDSGLTVVRQEITVTDGKYLGRDYVALERSARDALGDVRIVTDTGEGVYNLAMYYHAMATEYGELTNLLNALYSYCECAIIYANASSQP